ncbi:MAG: radical SAM family heme chaperone HemW [Candidatus Acidiferrales bacterium]
MNLGIYIQVPFCQTKCTYCNFHTGVVARERYEPYAAAVCREISAFASGADAGALQNAIVDSVYFGGGTPSLLEPASLAEILDSLRRKFVLSHGAELARAEDSQEDPLERPEITIEADPETITSEKAAAWRAAGLSRISLGVQSFDDSELQAAGRVHRRTDVCAANEILRRAGFANIGMDLIAGLAHQTRQSWEESIARILDIRPEHISIYILEIDEGSRLGKESLAGGTRYGADAVPSDDEMVGSYESACGRLVAAGYEHYEISNWALPGYGSRHNLKYWRRDPYIGFGAGAHSFDGSKRWSNVHDPARYVSCIEQGISACEQVAVVTAEEALEEELFLGLRQLEGIDLAQVESRYNVSLQERLTPLCQQRMLELNGTQLRLAPDRLTISNEIFVELLGQGVGRA